MSKDRAVGKNGGDFAIVCKSCGIPVLQDKECMTNPSNLLLDIDFFVYIGFFCHTFLHPLFYTPNQRITELQDKEAVHFGCNSLHNIDKKRCTFYTLFFTLFHLSKSSHKPHLTAHRATFPGILILFSFKKNKLTDCSP